MRPAKQQTDLSPRQSQITALVVRGYRLKEIAATLGISERAVSAHLTKLRACYGVADRSGLIAAALASAGFAVTSPPRRFARAPFLVAVTRGPDHEFTYVNDMWERVMGLRRRDVVGRTARDVFPHRSRSTYAARQRAYRSGAPATGKAWHYRWTTADGKERESDFRFMYQPLRGRRGRIEGLLLIATEAAD